TGAGIMDCKAALAEAEGDIARAMVLLREKGFAAAAKKAGRVAAEGLVVSYIHPGGRIGVLLELNCETDFVARTERFATLARDLAMQVAACNPASETFFLEQPFIKNLDITAGDLVKEAITAFGENIVVRRFCRYQLGEGLTKG
ncbi:MAG: elongation factor Ts, partial [candidate division NC10 bacterium]|nr:elongation factor Ts [candidate division NC10 bacterium]